MARKVVLQLIAALAGAVLLSTAAAQEDELDSALQAAEAETAAEGGGDVRAQAAAQPPVTDDKQVLSTFYHRRGRAFQRLGDYPRARADLEAALANNQPDRLAIGGWGDRNRIESDLGNAIEQSGDWFAAVEFWRGVVERSAGESAAGGQRGGKGGGKGGGQRGAPRGFQRGPGPDPFRLHWAQLRLANASSLLGSFRDAESLIKEADETMAAVRNTKRWGFIGEHHLALSNKFHADLKEHQGDL
jgi:tetratricopeptide (TPR) repeat protein